MTVSSGELAEVELATYNCTSFAIRTLSAGGGCMLLFWPVSVDSWVLVYYANASSQKKVCRSSHSWHTSSWHFLEGLTLYPTHPSANYHTLHLTLYYYCCFYIMLLCGWLGLKHQLTDQIKYYSLLSSWLTATMLVSHVILNEWLYPLFLIFYSALFNDVLTALSGCCMAGVMWNFFCLSNRFCLHHTTMHQFSVTSFKATKVGCIWI